MFPNPHLWPCGGSTTKLADVQAEERRHDNFPLFVCRSNQLAPSCEGPPKPPLRTAIQRPKGARGRQASHQLENLPLPTFEPGADMAHGCQPARHRNAHNLPRRAGRIQPMPYSVLWSSSKFPSPDWAPGRQDPRTSRGPIVGTGKAVRSAE